MQAGATVAHEGVCLLDVCGGEQNVECAAGQVCLIEKGVCKDGAPGTGAEEPDVCSGSKLDVCGCDDVTYSNECMALKAVATEESDGACNVEPGTCGGNAGIPCEKGETCAIDAGMCHTDATGTCMSTGGECLDLFDPVCGCDEETYDNACLATRAGVTVKSEGECSTTMP